MHSIRFPPAFVSFYSSAFDAQNFSHPWIFIKCFIVYNNSCCTNNWFGPQSEKQKCFVSFYLQKLLHLCYVLGGQNWWSPKLYINGRAVEIFLEICLKNDIQKKEKPYNVNAV